MEWLLTGYLGIILFLFLTGCGLPIPEELGIVTAGYLSSTGTLDWPIALASAIFGALAGDCAIYWIGFHFGKAVLREHPWWVGFLTPEREKKAEYLIKHHGLKLLFVIRFLPGLRLPVYLTTGILKMPFRRFLLIDGLCATVVVTLFFFLSYFFGQQVKDVIQQVEHGLLYTVLGVAAAAVIIGYAIRYRRRMRQLQESGNGDNANPDIASLPTEASAAGNGQPTDVSTPDRDLSS